MTRITVLVLCVLAGCGDSDDATTDAGHDSAVITDSGGSGGIGGASATGGVGGSGGTGGSSGAGDSITCAPIALTTAGAITVSPSQAAELDQIVFDAPAGATILLDDGTYPIDAILQAHRDGITLASASRDASLVTIDASYTVPEAIAITASNVTVAHLTITRAIDHLIHAYTTGSDVTGMRLHDLTLIDGGEQFVKVNPGSAGYIDGGEVSCSRFVMTDAGRPHVESCCGGCYTGGIDVHAARDWHVHDNRFEGIYCDSGLAEHAIHFWKGSRDTLIERNLIGDCARGIGVGLDNGTGTRVYPDGVGSAEQHAHVGGIVRNNGIWAATTAFDTGIEIHDATNVLVANNTVVSSDAATSFFSSIDYRFAGTSVTLVNNLTRRITARDGANATLTTNLEAVSLSWFADPAALDFHLTTDATDAIDTGTPRDDLGLDLDGDDHGAVPDLGADETR